MPTHDEMRAIAEAATLRKELREWKAAFRAGKRDWEYCRKAWDEERDALLGRLAMLDELAAKEARIAELREANTVRLPAGLDADRIEWLALLMMNYLHAHVPESERPLSMSDLSDEQAQRAINAVMGLIAALADQPAEWKGDPGCP